MLPDAAMAGAALAYVMETAQVLALRLDSLQRVVGANTHAKKVLGPDVVGRMLAELVVGFTLMPASSDDSLQRLSLSTAAGVPETFQFRHFELPDGTLALGSLDASEQEHVQTELLGLNAELNNLTRQLYLANAESRELSLLKSRFLGMAAHDLRTPLSAILLYGELLLEEPEGRCVDRHREFAQTCLDAAANMKRLIDDFLDVSIIESGKFRLELAPASAAEILAGVEPTAQLMAGRKRVSLVVAPADQAGRLPVDAPKIQQVLLNLVRNAVEHSVPGQRVWFSSRWGNRSLGFAVRDEGPGIAREDQARLFSAFARAGTLKTAGERSVGLGLAIARLIVEAHGGHIAVESTPGQGATFRFELPTPSPGPNQEPASP